MIAKEITIDEYDYIACDEWHYILDDATFVDSTDLIMDYIKTRKESVVILMSATAFHLYAILDHKNYIDRVYEIKHDYSYVDKLVFFHDSKTILKEIDRILAETDDKIIYFSNSVKEAYSLHERYKEQSYFYCSKSNKEYRKVSNCHCIGSKGIDSSNGEMGSYKGKYEKELRPVRLFKKDFNEFSDKYLKGNRRCRNDIMYLNEKGNLEVNKIIELKYWINFLELNKMQEVTYKRRVLDILGSSITDEKVIDLKYEYDMKLLEGLKAYLDFMCGKNYLKRNKKN